jgi:hypothetical protein
VIVCSLKFPWKIALVPSIEAAVAISLDKNFKSWRGSLFNFKHISLKLKTIVFGPFIAQEGSGTSKRSPEEAFWEIFLNALSRYFEYWLAKGLLLQIEIIFLINF